MAPPVSALADLPTARSADRLGNVLAAIARFVINSPRRTITIALLVMVGTAVFGIPVADSLSGAGFQDPNADSTRASNLLATKFGQGDLQMLITVNSNDGVRSGAAHGIGTDIAHRLESSPYVAHVTSPWTAPPSASASLISKDGKTGVIVAGVKGSRRDAQKHAQALSNELVHNRDGVTVRAGGEAITSNQTKLQTQKDLRVMEACAIPLSFVALVWAFGGLVAAALPFAIGLFAIFGSMAVLRAITFATDVSIFALNLLAAMGLALAIDYTLMILSRFRDELADGAGRDEALVRTMATAGRTVLFSAMTVALSMSALLLFPMHFLKSFAYAGVAVVAFAAVAAIIVTPAAIALLGRRLDFLDLHRLTRRLLRRPEPGQRAVQQTFWYRLAKFAMRRAVPIGLAIIALFIALGMPFSGVKWGTYDDRVLPQSASARQVGDQLRNDFAHDLAANVVVVIPDSHGVTPADLDRYASQLSRAADVSSVSAPGGTFVAGRRVGPPSAGTAMKDGSAFLTVASSARLYSQASNTQLDRLYAVGGPNGRHVLLGGTGAENRDTAHAVSSRLPLVLSVIAAITFVLLFLLTGSVIMPVKALVLNCLSLTASFGALVWIFQDGNLGGFGTTATGSLVVIIPVLLFCIAFGLSMDYEVFLVSRIREYWLASNRTAADNGESVALGLARTGRVITAAALIMSISFAALTTAHVSFMRMFGVGLTLAVLADATLVRMLLVPAFMHVMGRLNWWAPKPLALLREWFRTSGSARTSARAADVQPPVSFDERARTARRLTVRLAAIPRRTRRVATGPTAAVSGPHQESKAS
jgi:putative drug exporter of the RND superfamily